MKLLADNNFGDNLGDGVASPIALLIIVLMVIAVVFLMRSMNSRLKRLQSRFPDGQGSFDPPAEKATPTDDKTA
jgi:hypothetical protein